MSTVPPVPPSENDPDRVPPVPPADTPAEQPSAPYTPPAEPYAAPPAAPSTGGAVPGTLPGSTPPAQPTQPYGQPNQPYGQQPNQPYGQPAYGQPAYGAPGATRPQTLSVVSMITGIAGIIFTWVPILGFLSSVAAVITGHMAQNREPHAKPFWLTGIITGYIGIAFGLLFTFLILVLPFLVLGSIPNSSF